MDKISAVLITCILLLIGVNGIIIYNTWIAVDDGPKVVRTLSESDYSDHELIFNDDTSIVNNVDKKLWIRVKIIYNNKNNEEEYEIISEAAQAGCWQRSNDGWFYYRDPLTAGKITRPLIDKLLYDGKDVSYGDTSKFKLQAEAVDEAWLSESPKNGKHAFKIFESVCLRRNTEKSL